MLFCMRTTLNLEDDLLIQAKRLAAQRGATLTAVIEDALRLEMLRVRDTRERPALELRSFGDPEGGLAPGVDLDDSAALLDLMEDDAPLDSRR
jgi:hypothetical protein